MDWYYSDGRQQFGPVTQPQLDSLIADGRLQQDHLVWRAGMTEWAPVSSLTRNATAAAAAADSGAVVATEAPHEVRFCTQCGTAHDAGDLLLIGNGMVCANCKDPWLQRLREGVLPGGLTQSSRIYGGFWIRVAAMLTDGIILWIAEMLIDLPFTLAFATVQSGKAPAVGRMFGYFSITLFLNMAVAALYEAAFVVYKGATPGKLALSLRVIREDGTRPGWGLAIGRYFAKLVSSFTMCIGFIMVGLDDEKRGLHDRICNTRVIRV